MDSKPTVAVDLDSTLARTLTEAFALLEGEDHCYEYEDVTSWAWPIEKFGKDRFLHAAWNVWSIRPRMVSPIEENLEQKLTRLHQNYNIHIVTHQPDKAVITDGKKKWLQHQNIPYNRFVPHTGDESKAHLGYKYFIDDKPTLPSACSDDQTVYLRDQPYNQDTTAPHIRVKSIEEAVTQLNNRN